MDKTIDELRSEIDQLRAARTRIVAAATAERRGIERDLHDGVQQHLVALAVNVQLARQLVDAAADSRPLLEAIARDVREALENVRELAGRVYPPLLADRGLAEALAGAASSAAIRTRVDTADLGRYTADIEAAVYFSCVEALQDAAANAPAGSAATVRVWEEGGELRFQVTDDGGSVAATGSLSAMSVDRVNALGGDIALSPDPTGHRRILGAIPLPR